MIPVRWLIVEYRGRSGLEQIEPDWRRLYSSMPARSRYHSYEAQRAYLDHLCDDPERTRFLALKDGSGTVRAICPLEAAIDPSLRLPLRAWALPSHDHWLGTEVVAADDEARQALLPAVIDHVRSHREGRSLLLLGPVREDRGLCAAAAKLPPGTRCLHDTHPSARFDTTVSYDRLMEGMSKHFRRNLRNRHNKLHATGEVRCATISGVGTGPDGSGVPDSADPDKLAAAFEDFLAIEASGWKGRAGTASAIALRPHLVAFYTALMTTVAAPEDHCEINSLYLDGRCVAAQFCMRAGAEYSILKIAYDEEFARLGPGQLLFQTTLERCCADPGIAYVDLVTDAPWMRDWQAGLMQMGQAHISLTPVWGRALIAALRFRHGPARRLVQKYRSHRADRQRPAPGRRTVALPATPVVPAGASENRPDPSQ